MLPPERLADVFARAGVRTDAPSVVTTCGSGVTAAVVTLALEQIGRSDVRLYDGSWSEWASDASMPVVTGPADKA